MKDRKRYILKDAVVLMIVTALVLTAIPAVTADTSDGVKNDGSLTGILDRGRTNRILRITDLQENPSMGGGFGVDAWLGYNDGSAEVFLGVASGADYCSAVELSDVELASYRDHSITDIYFASDYSVPYDIWIENTRPADPILGTVNVVASGITPGSQSWVSIDVVDTPIPDTGSVWIGINFYTTAYPSSYPWAIDTDTHPAHDRGDSFYYTYYGGWATLSTDLPTYDGVNCIDVGVSLVEEPTGECLPDQCDFEIVSINNIPDGVINSLPHIINITIRNNGEVGIPELKLLADVYEKVCGPTTELCCDKVYDLCDWETEAADDWTWLDDNDGDTWVLQGGADNRWLTNDQAWRNTKGEDRSYGGDDDVYLGLSPGAAGYDELIWHCAEKDVDGDGIIDYTNDISGAACATFTFNHWCEGEYTFDEDDNVIPVDYGTIAYSFDGFNWVELPFSDFLAYDTEDQWEEVTLRFINTAIYPAYSKVCDDCTAEDGDIVINLDFPAVAKLQVKFIWHKDVCCQYEGWYIDKTCLTRTEMYELLLVHQTHEIIDMDPCVGEPENIYYEFPLGFDPDPDTWYQICILGQVFDCPDCCEQIFDNNEMCIQFYVTDVHDMACVDIELTDPADEFYVPGDHVCVDMTVKNVGTFAENNVPVDLKVGKRIVETIFVDAETDPFSDMGHVNFGGGELFAWTKGRTDIENIGTGARSIAPGTESIIFAADEVPYAYFPQTPEGAIDGLAFNDAIDPDGLNGATLSFYAKWSLPYVDNYCSLLIHPDWAGNTWYIDEDINADYDYMNEWYYFEFDLLNDIFTKYKQDPDVWPVFDIGFIVYTLTNDGTCVPPSNPYPWSGLMLDDINLDLITCGEMTTVDTQYTGPLAPGQEEVITLCWNETEFCNWCLCGDIQLATDVDPTNDICCLKEGVSVKDSYPVEQWKTWDLTADDGECLWHICCTRNCDGTCCAWAGVEEEHHCHYVNDMDDSMISPQFNLSAYAAYGVSLNFSTWYEFVDDGDFGEVWVRLNASNPWVLLETITDNSSGFFEEIGVYVPEEYCGPETQFRFRIVTDDDGYGEGWYVCNVCIIDVIDLAAPPVGAPGATIFYQTVLPSTNSLWSFINIDETLGYAGADNFQISADVTIGGVSIVGLSIHYSGGWVFFDPVLTVMDCVFYDDPYSPFAQPTNVLDTFSLTGAGADSIVLTGDTYSGFDAYEYKWTLPYSIEVDDQDGWMYLDGPTGYSPLWGNSFDGDSDSYQINAGVWGATADDRAYGLYEGQPNIIPVYGGAIWCDYFDRLVIAPWTCEKTTAGNYWDLDEQKISGYPGDGKGLNNAMYTLLDFTDPDLSYVEFYFLTNWSIEAGCHAYVEVSPNWDGTSSMDSATWVLLWEQAGPSDSGDWKTSREIGGHIFELNEYLGQEVYLRFRYTTPGNGFATADGFWDMDDKQVIFKLETAAVAEDTEPPVTNIFFDSITAKVTLVATDYPLLKNSGIKATYYKIDSGDFKVYGTPFAIPEGKHTVYYYSEDNNNNVEATKSKEYTVDTTPPTVTIIEPKEGWLYLFGSPIMERILADTTLCIGKVPIEATATDEGSGVNAVLFAFDGKTSWDDSSPYTAEFKGMKFGDLTISAKAIDNGGLESAPDTITVKVFCIGLF